MQTTANGKYAGERDATWPGVSRKWQNRAEELLTCPQFPQVLNFLELRLREEKIRRQRFYQDITPEDKWEFIDGEVVMHSPARNAHLVAQLHLVRVMSVFVDQRRLGAVRLEKCLCAFTRNDYEPDIVFFGPEKSAALRPETMKFPVPDLAVEVLSESTAARDRGVKFEDYAAHGVGEYWIVDAEAEVVEQYLNDGQGGWTLTMKSGSGEIISKIILGLRIPVRAIFDAQENLRTLTALAVGQ